MAKLPDWNTWLRTAEPVQQTARLGRRYIYILPTRHGWTFGLLLIAMLVGAINYALSLGFMLTFLLAGLGIIAMLHTWRNLAHLTITSGRLHPTFAGDMARWDITITEPDGLPRFAIAIQCDGSPMIWEDIPAGTPSQVTLEVAAMHRGWLTPPRISLFTEFPLGLYHAWAYARLDARGIVYPKPAPPGNPIPSLASSQTGEGHAPLPGDDDFSGLRPFQAGDSPRRIDWKASAREQGLHTKQFDSAADRSLWLDWNHTEGHTEQRLSQLSRWILDTRDLGQPYGLRLPDNVIQPGRGEQHERSCLEALALFGG